VFHLVFIIIVKQIHTKLSGWHDGLASGLSACPGGYDKDAVTTERGSPHRCRGESLQCVCLFNQMFAAKKETILIPMSGRKNGNQMFTNTCVDL
jgi:hypothetical protein